MKNLMSEKWYYMIPVVMLLLTFLDWDYWYFQVLRWVVAISAAFIAYYNYEAGSKYWPWVFGAVAILFNPISPIHLDRETWTVIDVVVAGIFAIAIFKDKANQN